MAFSAKIESFGPIIPRTAERHLPNNYAQSASNVDLLANEISPIRQPLTVTSLLANDLAVYRAEYLSTNIWRGWTMDVDVCRIPLAADVAYRYAWSGDGPPRWTKYNDFGTPASDKQLGIPNPTAVPVVVPSGGVGAAVSRLYCYTFWSQDGEESGPSPATALTTGKVDDTWAISGMDAFPANTSTNQAMPSTFFVTPTNTVANASGSAVAITSSTNANPSVITKVAHGFVTDDRVFITGHTTNTAINNTPTNPTWRVVKLTADTYSLKTEAGVDVAGNGVGGATGNAYKCTKHWLRATDQLTFNLSATQYTVASVVSEYAFTVSSTTDLHTAVTWTRVASWNTTGMTRRIYRSAGTNAAFALVVENLTTTTYNDTILDANIPGDDLISATWLPPPTGLIAIHALPTGSLVGINGSQVCYSEPYQAHAWPDANKFGMLYTGVGLDSFGSTVVVGTLGAPAILDGVDPASTTMQSVDNVWPCLSKRSVTSLGDGVTYATTHGMVSVGTGPPTIWTHPYYTRKEWSALNPASMVVEMAEGKVFVRYQPVDDASSHILVFIPDEPIASLTTLEVPCVELYVDDRNGHMYFVNTYGVQQYDAGSGNALTYSWLSKEYELPAPVNIGAARVEFVATMSGADYAAALATYNAEVAAQGAKIAGGVGAINGRKVGVNFNSAVNGYTPTLPAHPQAANVSFYLYSKGTVMFSTTVYANDAFRLPAGFKTDAYAIRLDGTVRVKNVQLGETMRALGDV